MAINIHTKKIGRKKKVRKVGVNSLSLWLKAENRPHKVGCSNPLIGRLTIDHKRVEIQWSW